MKRLNPTDEFYSPPHEDGCYYCYSEDYNLSYSGVINCYIHTECIQELANKYPKGHDDILDSFVEEFEIVRKNVQKKPKKEKRTGKKVSGKSSKAS